MVAADGTPAFEDDVAGGVGSAEQESAGFDAAAPGSVHGHHDVGADLFEQGRGVAEDELAVRAAPCFRGYLRLRIRHATLDIYH